MDALHVLLVEDERTLALVAQRQLEQLGYRVTVAEDGETALAVAQRDTPDLVLMDIVLGSSGSDGVEVASKLLERHDLPLIYLTACDDDATIARAARTAAYGYVLKPVQGPELRSAMAMALGRHQAERRLRQTKELLWTTLRAIRDGVITTDRQGRVVMLNAAAEQLLDVAVEDVVGRSLRTALLLDDPEDHRRLAEGLDRVLGGGEELHLHRTALRTREGEVVDIDLHAASIADQAGEAGVVLVLRDIAEQLRNEVELLRRQKLEAIGQLAGGLAHDFNNLLMAMLSNVALARLHCKSDDDVYEILMQAEQAAQRATTLTRQLLLFSDGSGVQRRVLELGPLLRHQTQLSLHRSAVSARFELPAGLWRVEADEQQLTQLVHSLVLAAREAMPSGGSLALRAKNVELSDGEVGDLPTGRYVELELEDQGEVLSEADRSRIFEPYQSVGRPAGGLLLTAAYSIARHHGGLLSARTAPDEQGMIFTLLLPATEQAADELRTPRTTVEGSGFVLVMDDEELICSSVGRLLARLGYRYETACDGEEAISRYEAARSRGEAFDVVILDWTVPGGLGGEETLTRLRALDPDVRAILATGYARRSRDVDFAALGFGCILFKPYTMEELSTAVAETLADD